MRKKKTSPVNWHEMSHGRLLVDITVVAGAATSASDA